MTFLVAGIGWIAPQNRAEACGGLFCDRQAPVFQTGEQIVFAVDRQANTVDAVINVQYQGPASQFAWVLPLQSEPEQIRVAPNQVFTAINNLTTPQFNVTRETRGICSQDIAFGAAERTVAVPSVDTGVEVLSNDEVGPYETVVLKSNDPEDIRKWLEENEYQVTEAMMESVVPYVAKGDTLLALKLRKDRDAGDIQPIWVSMKGSLACVPLRMTAIAATDDMGVTVTVLSNEGRAIPSNYNHVKLNLARIDWARRGANYRQVLSEAVDEGSGNAFTTEFAGSARIFDEQIAPEMGFNREALEEARNVSHWYEILRNQGVTVNQDNMDIAERAQAAGFNGFNVFAATEEVWSNILQPRVDIQKLFDQYGYATRVYTLISPEEMNIDPEFEYRADLPDVSNIHNATIISDCGLGGSPGDAGRELIIEETGQSFDLDDQPRLDALPAAAMVEQLFERRVITDNTDIIESAMTACGCTTAKTTGSNGMMGGLALLAGMLVFRRREN